MPIILDPEQYKQIRKKRTNRVQKRPKPSVKVEGDFRKRLNKLWTDVLLPATERIKQAVDSGAGPEYIADIIQSALHEANWRYNIDSTDIVSSWELSMGRDTRRAFEESIHHSLGIDVGLMLDSEQAKSVLSIASIEARSRIVSIPSQHLGGVAKAVADNFLGIQQPEGRTLTQQIHELGAKSKQHAKLIARDQTSKVTGRLNQARQQDIGVEIYKWETSRDQRVVGNPGGLYPKGNKAHGNHYKMQGLYCRWDDPTVHSDDKGKTWKPRTSDMPQDHPGQDIQCRCWARAIIDIDKMIAEAEVV